MARKIIGIAGGFRQVADAHTDEFYLSSEYFDAVESIGAVPLLLPPVNHEQTLEEALDRMDALILSGGPDTPPWRYGQTPRPETNPVHPRRDGFDRRLIQAALKRRMPILGICHGCQLLNVHFGGTLIQHLPTFSHHHRPGRPRLRHIVNVAAGTRLASIVGAGPLEVNSSHHQAVDQVAQGLRVAAVSDDGVIEAIEPLDDGPVLGVQWHPEEMTDNPQQMKLFCWLVNARSSKCG